MIKINKTAEPQAWDNELNGNLNLNHPLLKSNRRETLLGMIDSMGKSKANGKPWGISDVRAQLNKWKGRHTDSAGHSVLRPYCGIVIYFLTKKEAQLKKGK